ncbi:zinc-regulated transporter 2 [Metschnikowia bicuspidata]|uniref:Zinc-regulated transporter 2 n=1 Tax=Metschnikowia bicuspidata TaxID=27322 RepID=A0A4V1J3Q3_9ASCO|nr:zinc-regulated transporter 2 [Metschnikowia bicuspidata]
MNTRIASIFVLLVVSAAGSFTPILATTYQSWGLSSWVIYVCRYFGSGVILATAFIHLLGESNTSFANPCLGEAAREYLWGSALALIGVFTMFTIELASQRIVDMKDARRRRHVAAATDINFAGLTDDPNCASHTRNIADAFQKLFNIFLLEFGIVFHSVFVGLSMAVAGDQFMTLFIVISFHQFFEGLGLGSRFATAQWPPKMKWYPSYLALAYSLTTPIGIAAGLGVRHLYLSNDSRSLLIVGIFDGFNSGLLIYGSLIELMGRDFLMNPEMKKRSNSWLILAYAMFILGTLFMALVGKWA